MNSAGKHRQPVEAVRVRLHCIENERDIASRCVHSELNLIFNLSSDKIKERNSLSCSLLFSVNGP